MPDPATDLRADVVLGPRDLNSDGDEGDMADTGRYASDMEKIQEWNNSTEHPERIDLRWTAPEDPPGAPVTGYEIEYSSDGSRWFELEEMIGTDEAYRDISLIANEVRYYRVYAWNVVGRSLVSENAAFETSGPSLTPVLPAKITHIVMSPNATDLRITWTTPPNPLGDPVVRYEIQAKASAMDDSGYRSVVTGSFADNLRIDANTTTFVTSSQDLSRADGPNIAFEAGKLVDVRIRPGNRAGFSGDDTSSSGDEWLEISNIPWGDPKLPLKQRQPRAEQDTEQNEGRSGLDVYWYPAKFVTRQGPDEDGNDATDFESQVRYVLVIGNEEEAEADSYRMEDGAAAGQADTRGHVGADDARQTTNDDNLETQRSRQYTVYPVRVRADLSPTFSISGHDVSPDTLDVIRGFPSETSTGITNRPLPPGTPEDFFVSEDGHTEIRLTWAKPEENPDRLCQNTVDDAVGNDRRLGGGATSNPELEDDGSECGKSVITEYRVYMSEDGITDWDHLASVPAGDTGSLATELTPGQRYYFRVSAVNSNQEGDPTEHESSVTEQTDMPTPPGGLVAQAVSSSQLKMCWFSHNLLDPQTGEALDEDLPVLGYRITYVDADGNEVILVSNTMSMDTVYEDPSVLEPNETRTYRVRGINLANLHLVDDETDATLGGTPYAEASATTDEAPPNTAPMAGAAIPDRTVTVDGTVMVQSTITDADTDDTLTWSVMSDMEMYATATVDNMGMVTITGVAAGSATITVTAMDMAGESATQDIMVTVEAADTTPRAPSGVTATVDDADPGNTMVTVDFTPGANIPAHGVVLFTSDFSSWPYIARAMGNSHTFENVASGSYIAVVVALDAQGGLITDDQGNYLADPANAITVGN